MCGWLPRALRDKVFLELGTPAQMPLLAPKLTLAEDPKLTLIPDRYFHFLTSLSQGSHSNIRPAPRHSHKEEATQVRVFTKVREDIGLLIAESHFRGKSLPCQRRSRTVVDIIRVARTLYRAPWIPKVQAKRRVHPTLVEACEQAELILLNTLVLGAALEHKGGRMLEDPLRRTCLRVPFRNAHIGGRIAAPVLH
jgi:hypothetical protein